MKASTQHCLFLIAFMLSLAGTHSELIFAQNSGSGSMVSSPPSPQPWGGDAKPPADLKRAHTEEELRYDGFFQELRSWEDIANQEESAGNSGWAEHWRTKLERESGLTASEAAEIKQIIDQYFRDEQAREQQENDIRTQAMSENPGTWRQALYSNQDYINLANQRFGLIDQTISRLVSALGPKRFTRLDLYTLHMHDRMKAAQVRKRAESSQEGRDK